MTNLVAEAPSSFSPEADVPAASGRADHFLGLDLLRGLAALAVVEFHCSSRMDLPLLFAHGYLAVDFFFVLSGFVIAKAYGGRLTSGRMSLRRFALVRGIRLMPLVVIGTLLAAVIEVGRPGITDQQAHIHDLVLAVVMGASLVPTLVRTTLEYTVFPLNGPFWSLSLEAVANAVFGVCVRGRPGLIVLVSALAICAPCLVWAVWTHGEAGFGSVPTTYWLGYSRVGWSFSAGIVLYRFRGSAPRVPLIVSSAALTAVLLAPASSGPVGQTFDLCAVLFGLPAIVWVASTARLGPEGQRWSAWSGDLSYPIYALHYPIIRVVGLLTLRMSLPLAGRLGIAVVSTVLIVIAASVAYACLDVPVRRWLTAKAVQAFPVRSGGA